MIDLTKRYHAQMNAFEVCRLLQAWQRLGVVMTENRRILFAYLLRSAFSNINEPKMIADVLKLSMKLGLNDKHFKTMLSEYPALSLTLNQLLEVEESAMIMSHLKQLGYVVSNNLRTSTNTGNHNVIQRIVNIKKLVPPPRVLIHMLSVR